jgi:hypothetical protein
MIEAEIPFVPDYRLADGQPISANFCNNTAAPITPTPAETYTFMFQKGEGK